MWTVYRLLNEANELLYVGCTGQPLGVRIGQHRRTQPWADEIAGHEFKSYDDEITARRVEMEAIETEAPRYNRRAGYLPVAESPMTDGEARAAVKYLLVQGPLEETDLYRALKTPEQDGDAHNRGLLVRALFRNGFTLAEIERGTGVTSAVLAEWADQ